MNHPTETSSLTTVEKAIQTLNMGPLTLFSSNAEVMRHVSSYEVTIALIDNLNLGGYLDDKILREAVYTLSLAKPFAKDQAALAEDLCRSRLNAIKNEQFSAAEFIAQLGMIDYLTHEDLIHILLYCSQTAFDRKLGQERNQMQTKPWLIAHRDRFLANCEALGLTRSRANWKLPEIDTVLVMGASYPRMVLRWNFFTAELGQAKEAVFCVGNRELSVGFETEELIKQVADFHGIKHQGEFEKRADGRTYLKSEKPVTESMMSAHFLSQQKAEKVKLLDSETTAGHWEKHWRTSATSNADDLAKQLVVRLKAMPSLPASPINVVVVAEQPFSERMAIKVRSTIKKELRQAGLSTDLVHVISAGPILNEKELVAKPESEQGLLLSVINSDQAGYIAEAYDSVLPLYPQLGVRSFDAMLFSKRTDWRTKKEAEQKAKEAGQQAKSDQAVSVASLIPAMSSPIFTPAASAATAAVNSTTLAPAPSIPSSEMKSNP